MDQRANKTLSITVDKSTDLSELFEVGLDVVDGRGRAETSDEHLLGPCNQLHVQTTTSQHCMPASSGVTMQDLCEGDTKLLSHNCIMTRNNTLKPRLNYTAAAVAEYKCVWRDNHTKSLSDFLCSSKVNWKN